MKSLLKIATRSSPLALWQANFIKQSLLKIHPDLKIELIHITTEADLKLDISLQQIGGKGLFVKALQQHLLEGSADIAVHSIKDMSVQTVKGLCLAAICKREDPRDAFVSNRYTQLSDLPENAIVGTSSPRRESLLKQHYPHLRTQLLRGNVGTRLKKLDNNEYDGIILAAAGLIRLDLTDRIQQYLDPTVFIPAIAQGALGIECQEDNNDLLNLLNPLNHKPTQFRVLAERAVNQKLGGDCHTPIGAFATIKSNILYLNAMVGSLKNNKALFSQKSAKLDHYFQLGLDVANDLLAQGAEQLLRVR